MQKLTVRLRIEHVSFSLYWKEPLSVETDCLDDMVLDIQDLHDLTGQEVLAMVAKRQGWHPVETLQRLEGFHDPWERLIVRGRELDQSLKLVDQGLTQSDVLVVVRRNLKADGWRILQKDDFLSDDDE